jgi:hypothetical protein
VVMMLMSRTSVHKRRHPMLASMLSVHTYATDRFPAVCARNRCSAR